MKQIMITKRAVRRLFAALDLGSSKVSILVAELSTEDSLKIVAMGVAPCHGLKKGQIFQKNEVEKAIAHAVQNAESLLGAPLPDVAVSVAGDYIQSFNAQSMLTVQGPEITMADIEHVVAEAKSLNISENQELLHVLPQIFVIDQKEQTQDPVGRPGTCIEAYVHVITALRLTTQEIRQCLERQTLKVSDCVLSALASGLAVLTQDEKELGVCLIDIGASTTHVAIFYNGAVTFSSFIPIGGDHVTQDIAHILGSGMQVAETVKIQQGLALRAMAIEGEHIDVKISLEAPVKRLPITVLSEVIEARMHEILSQVAEMIAEEGLKEYISAGVVLTGGGCKIPGTLELTANIFNQPVRLGFPQYVTGFNDAIYDPSHSTGVGLLMYAKLQQEGYLGCARRLTLRCTWWEPLKNWFKQFF